MSAEDGVDPFEDALGDHGECAGQELLGGLEAEAHSGGKTLAQPGEDVGEAERCGEMQVMAAQVCSPPSCRELETRGFADREGIEFSPHEDSGPRSHALQVCDHSGARHAGSHRQPKLAQLAGQQAGGACHVEPGLGMGVDVATQGDELGLESREIALHGRGHGWRGDQRGSFRGPGRWERRRRLAVHGVAPSGDRTNPSWVSSES